MRAVVRNAKRIKPRVKRTELPTRVEIKELDPLRKCGPGTSVQRLYRVLERTDGLTTSHLVFLDRHGWYCVHGRACPAVGLAKKKAGRRLVR
jgi:hypothetical protein